jgi:hypothetical protein
MLQSGMNEFEREHSTSDKVLIIRDKPLVTSHTAVSHRPFKTCAMNVANPGGGNAYDYYSFSSIGNLRSLQLVFFDGKEGFKDISLPNEMKERLASFLRDKNRNLKEMDCGLFAFYVNGLSLENVNGDAGNFWDYSQMNNEKKLVPGSTVALTVAEGIGRYKSTHYAVYLGEHLYISKGGNNYDLIVTDIENMRTVYGSDTIFVLKPKSDRLRK